MTALLGVAGCGFQLLGSETVRFESLSIVGAGAAPLTSRSLRQALENRNLRLVPTSPDVISIHMLDERFYRRSFATTDLYSTAQYELRLELDVSISRGKNSLLEDATLISQRVYALDLNNLSASQEEQKLLLTEMRVNLAEQLLRRVNFLVRPAP